MFSIVNGVTKAKKGFLTHHIKPQKEDDHPQEEEDAQSIFTLEQMARDERNNKDIPPDKYFFGKLNEIFSSILGPTIRREFNYFQVQDFLEEKLLRQLSFIEEDELWEYAIKILRKDVDKRLFEEIIILQKITENVEAFKQIRKVKGRMVLFQCLKNLRYKYGKIGTLLQKQGDPVKCLYIVLKGLVQIKQAPKKDESTPKEQDNQKQKPKKSTRNGSISRQSSFHESLEELKTVNKLKVTYLNKGMSYGDRYFLEKDDGLADNQAYLFDNCHLAYLEILKFKTILDDSILYKLQVEIAEFGKMNVIRLLEQKSIQMLYIRTHPVNLQRNNQIAKEGDKVESIYFVREGEVKLVKKIINENEQIGSSNAMDKTNSFQMQHQSAKFFDLALLIKGQFIGLEEFFKDQPYNSTSTVYSTQATLYQLPASDLQEYLSSNRESKRRIIEYFEREQADKELRQARLTQFNQAVGKVEPQEEKQSEEEILKNLQEGQSMIIRSNVNLSCTPYLGPKNLDFIMSSLQEVRAAKRNKMKKQDNSIKGFQFSEKDLQNINIDTYRFRRSLEKLSNSSNPPSNGYMEGQSYSPSKEGSRRSVFGILNKNAGQTLLSNLQDDQAEGQNQVKQQTKGSFRKSFLSVPKYQSNCQIDTELTYQPSQEIQTSVRNLDKKPNSSGFGKQFDFTKQQQRPIINKVDLCFHKVHKNSLHELFQPKNNLDRHQQQFSQYNFTNNSLKENNFKHVSCHTDMQHTEEKQQSFEELGSRNGFNENQDIFQEELKQQIKKSTKDFIHIDVPTQKEEGTQNKERGSIVFNTSYRTYGNLKNEELEKTSTNNQTQQIPPNSPSFFIKSFSQLPAISFPDQDSSQHSHPKQKVPSSCRTFQEMNVQIESPPSLFSSPLKKDTFPTNFNNNTADVRAAKGNTQSPFFQISTSNVHQDNIQGFSSTARSHSQHSLNQLLPLKYHVQQILDPKQSFLSRICKDRQARARQLNKKNLSSPSSPILPKNQGQF